MNICDSCPVSAQLEQLGTEMTVVPALLGVVVDQYGSVVNSAASIMRLENETADTEQEATTLTEGILDETTQYGGVVFELQNLAQELEAVASDDCGQEQPVSCPKVTRILSILGTMSTITRPIMDGPGESNA